jgi:DNA modification methylase
MGRSHILDQYAQNMGEQTKLVDERDGIVGIFNVGSISDSKSNTLEYPGEDKIKLFITDPPYNLNFDYGDEVNDSLPYDEYYQLLVDTFTKCYQISDDNAHLFIIHYPEQLATIFNDIIKIGWNYQQWIPWVYASNTGHSKSKWSTSHRAILWLTKGTPFFDPKGVTQNFKNPSVKKIQEKMAEGIHGVALYDWWEIPQVKNVNSEHKGYKNQIPEELIRRIVLCASKPLDWIADPFSGTYSTQRTALKHGRRGWGCDLNPLTKTYWPTIDDWSPRKSDPILANHDKSDYDEVLKKIPREQLDRALFKLLKNADEKTLTTAIGPKNGPRIYRIFHPED